MILDQSADQAGAGDAEITSAANSNQASSSDSRFISLPWFIAALIIVLLLGIAVGIAALDIYIRKRHSGIRIY